ncbi:MAG: type I DNA topoisomerase [Gammaproteobacteria bacterium]|nr:type I DNA topoisomerase [Gammaproteobacteria bacterium]MBL6819299.1 type I DNA topoisomerase [Gammaproteobacteria bacterium]MBL6898478.1 type I DNA topoisomerase [Gammaproteobacteria bacterium]
MKNLMIVESPTKVKSIEKFLGPDFKVIASVGHVRDLVSSARKGINVDEGFAPVWKVSSNKKTVIDDIKKHTKDADVIYFATDPDREGEAISKHLYDILDKAKFLKDKETHRVVFNEITKNAVTDALKRPRSISTSLWDAYLARRTLDYLMGYDISEFLWKKVSRDARAGRVQSPALRLIVEREIKINAFKPVEYWNIFANISNSKKDIQIELTHIEKEKIKKDNITNIVNSNEAESIKSRIEKYKSIKVTNIKEGQRKTKPKAPFTTASLQQTAYTSLGLSVKQTSAIAQRLYQGMDIGKGQSEGLISYMRTDSTNLSKDALKDISSYLDKNHPGLAEKQPRVFKSKSKNAQEAHEAIRPTSMENTPDRVKKYLEQNDFKLYDLIWKRTLASQMRDSRSKTVSVELSMENEFTFKYSGSYLEYPGYKEIYSYSDNDETEKDNKKILESLKEGDELILSNVDIEQKFTQPPARYNQASLIQALEELGIGRPSTYVTIINKIMESNYVDPEKSNFQPTALAKVVYETLINHFKDDLVDYEFTARLEEDLDKIANGEKEYMECVETTYKPFKTNLDNKIKTVDISEQRELKDLGFHPETKRPVTVRLTRYGPTIQMGTKDDEEKPKWAALTPEQKKNIDSITLDDAIRLFKLPEKIGEFEHEDILINIGPFGPYVKCGKTNVSMKDIDIFSLSESDAIVKIKEKREIDANREINIFESSGIKVLNGMYGPYVTDGKKNARIPKDVDPKSLDEITCIEMIKNAPKRRARRTRAKK